MTPWILLCREVCVCVHDLKWERRATLSGHLLFEGFSFLAISIYTKQTNAHTLQPTQQHNVSLSHMFRQLRRCNQMHIWLCACARVSLFVRFWVCCVACGTHLGLCLPICNCVCTPGVAWAHTYMVCAYLAFVCLHLNLFVYFWRFVCTSCPRCAHIAVGDRNIWCYHDSGF